MPPKRKIHVVQSTLQMAIVHMFMLFKTDPEEAKCFRNDTERMIRVAKLVNLSYASVERYVRKAQRGEELVTPAKKKKKNRTVTNVDDFCKEAIARYIIEKLQKGLAVTVKEVWRYVKDHYDIFLFRGGLTSMWSIIRSIGFVWRKGDRYRYMKLKDDVAVKRMHFLREYVKNLQSEKPRPVIFLDETWLFVNGKPPSKSWCNPTEKNAMIRRPAEGRRLVIVHAGSKDGFVANADLLFATNLKKGEDYHGAMDSGNFEKWVREKLLVGIKALGSCMIVLDNASYHSRILERQPTMKWRKDQLVDWLQRNGVFPPPNVNIEFLQGLCYKHRSQLKRYVVDEMLIEAGHKVLRLPPYHCEFNPIELVWGLTKRYYDKVICSEGGQGLERSIKVWKDALATVTPAVWRNCVQKTEELILQTYEEEAAGIPEVEDLIINVEDSSISSASSDRDCDSDSNEELAIPLNNSLSVPGPSTS